MDWWIENYILVIGLKFFQKLLRLLCSLMNSRQISLQVYFDVQRFFYLFDYVQSARKRISIIFC
jgi:hypothetical protein